MMNGNSIKIFAGSSVPNLARRICDELGMPLGAASIKRFNNGEVRVNIDESVRRAEVFVVQSLCTTTDGSVNDHFVELLLMLDALHRAGAESVRVVIPHLGYARQDRRSRGKREPISASVIMRVLEGQGVYGVITAELHAGQIQGFTSFPTDNLYCSGVHLEYLNGLELFNPVMVSPDAGGVDRARGYASALGAGLALVTKMRPKPGVAKALFFVGEANDRDVVIVDDMIDTAGTLKSAASMLKDKGARRIFAVAAHPVLSGPAVENIAESGLEQVIVMDTIPLSEAARTCSKIVVLSSAKLFAGAIRRVHEGSSVTEMGSFHDPD